MADVTLPPRDAEPLPPGVQAILDWSYQEFGRYSGARLRSRLMEVGFYVPDPVQDSPQDGSST